MNAHLRDTLYLVATVIGAMALAFGAVVVVAMLTGGLS